MGLLNRRIQQHSAEYFWSWFASNKVRIENIFSNPAVFDELMEVAQNYSKFVEFMVGKPKDTFQLFVSCNGFKEGIPAVEKLVASAPDLVGWDIIAFKQPLPLSEFQTVNDAVTYQDVYTVDAITASFTLIKDGGLYHLTIFSPEDRMEAGHKFAYYLMLDMLIGEYNVMTKLGNIDMVSTTDTGDRQPLVKIRDYFHIND